MDSSCFSGAHSLSKCYQLSVRAPKKSKMPDGCEMGPRGLSTARSSLEVGPGAEGPLWYAVLNTTRHLTRDTAGDRALGREDSQVLREAFNHPIAQRSRKISLQLNATVPSVKLSLIFVFTNKKPIRYNSRKRKNRSCNTRQVRSSSQSISVRDSQIVFPPERRN